MQKNRHSATPRRGLLDTLAQNETRFGEKPAIIISGNGTDLNKTKALKGRAKRKVITRSMVLSLIEVANKKKTPEWKKSYWNTYHCQNKLYTANGRLHGKYCKNRFCTLCCSIRKAEIINKYLPVIKIWAEPYFVTLTIKAIPAFRLHKLLRKVLQGFDRIKDKHRKRNARGKGIKLVGVKSLECNFNPKAKTYNPHLHLIVETKQMADILIDEWLKLWKSRWTNSAAQKSEKVGNTVKALIETVKYGSKICSEPDVNNKSKSDRKRTIHVSALDNIFKAMKGLRIFDRFGFNLPKGDDPETENSRIVQKYGEWLFEPKYFDWINTETEQSLSDYKPLFELIQLLNNNIDILLE